MPARFTLRFIDAQLRLPPEPAPVGNSTLDLLSKLAYLELTLGAIVEFVNSTLATNGRAVYSVSTMRQFQTLKQELLQVLSEAVQQSVEAGTIIGGYICFAKPVVTEAPTQAAAGSQTPATGSVASLSERDARLLAMVRRQLAGESLAA